MNAVTIVRQLPTRDAIEKAISTLIAVLDSIDGDIDLEDSETGNSAVDRHGRYLPGDCPAQDEDCEPTGDEQDSSFTEWTSRGRHKVTGDGTEQFDAKGIEDDELSEVDEDDDPPEDSDSDRCSAGDDMVRSGSALPTTYSRSDDGPGDADDAERESIEQDVPTLRAYSLDINAFTGERVYLGRENLLTSFRTNGQGTFSATTGKKLLTRGWAEKPGVPV